MTQVLSAKEALRNEVMDMLRLQGYSTTNDSFYLENVDATELRNLHLRARAERINQNIRFIESTSPVAEQFMLDSSELQISKIQPKLIEVQSGTVAAKLFRWWNLTWWSLPYEQAYGRQMRFLVWDDYHQAPIGLIGLQSPILCWAVRDKHLGITRTMREYWINQSLNAQRLGALPPYNKFLGGKLVSMIMASSAIRNCYRNKYMDCETVLMKRTIPANLLFITTTGAYGKSSVYNRLQFNDRKICEFIGYTRGTGSFHIPNSLYEGLVSYLRDNGIKAERGWGNGPSTKIQIITKSMRLLGFKNGSHHGIRRAVYLFPFVKNIRDVIHHGKSPVWEERNLDDLTSYWQKRWARKRTDNYPQENLQFTKKEFMKGVEEDLNRCKELFSNS